MIFETDPNKKRCDMFCPLLYTLFTSVLMWNINSFPYCQTSHTFAT